MRRRKFIFANRTNPLGTHLPKQLAQFDTLDWVAAFFVIATPLYIAYRLMWT